MPHDEIEFNTSIYSGSPANGSPELQAARTEQRYIMQTLLPKFKLEEGEELYISVEELHELNHLYFNLLDDMRRGFSITNAEMRSYMESVVTASYMSEIEKRQREGSIEGKHLREVHIFKSGLLKSEDVRRWWFCKKKPNYVKSLRIKEAQLEAEAELAKYRDEIATQEEFLYGETEEDPVHEKSSKVFEMLIENFVPPRKRKKFIEKNGSFIQSLLLTLMPKSSPTAPKQQETQEQQVVSAEPLSSSEEPKEEDESVEDELDELQEFEDQLEHVNAIVEDVDEPGEVELDHEEDFEEEFESEPGEEEKNSE